MIKEEYSPYKVIHHWDKIQQMKKGEQPVPAQAQIIISDLCNHSCSFCAYRMEGYTSSKNFGSWDSVKQMINKNPNRMIPFEKVIEILDDCVEMGVKAIQYTGGGEPTVHPKHKEIFEYTLNKGLELSLVSNGFIMKDGVPELLARSSWVRFSMDAGTKESYSSIRKVSIDGLDRFRSNIQKVVNAKIQNKSSVIIGIGFVVNKDNFKEIYEAVKIAHNLGVDNIRISAAFTPDNANYHLDYYEEAKDIINKSKADFESSNFIVFNLFGDRIQDLIQNKPDYNFCSYMQLTTYIGGDLKLYTCCNNAYNDFGEVGSLENQRFKDLWNSTQKKLFFQRFDAHKCERCMFNNKNEFVNYCLKDNPNHINFI